MTNTAKARFPDTIKELVAVHEGAALIFPNGVPKSIPNPQWSSAGYGDEYTTYGLQFFDVWSNRVPEIPLEVLRTFSWIYSLEMINGPECYPWFSVFMCGAYYEKDYLHDEEHSLLWWLEVILDSYLSRRLLLAPPDAILYYLKHFNYVWEEDEETLTIECSPPIVKADLKQYKYVGPDL